jgi:hypothetical protein
MTITEKLAQCLIDNLNKKGLLVNSLKERIFIVTDKILTWPDSVESYSPGQDADEIFFNLEAELKEILDQVSLLSGSEREDLNEVIYEFQEKMKQHYEITQQRLESMQKKISNNFEYVKAIEAYTKKNIHD